MAGSRIMSRSHTGAENKALTAWLGLISCHGHIQGLKLRQWLHGRVSYLPRPHPVAENKAVTAWPGVISCQDYIQGLKIRQ